MAKNVTTTVSDADSIEVTRNSKGEYTYSAKVYYDNLDDGQKKLVEIDDWFKETYPVKELPTA